MFAKQSEQSGSGMPYSRRGLLAALGTAGAALAGSGLAGASATVTADTAASNEATPTDPPDRPFAWLDGTGPGWVELGEKDFTNVNSADDTWSWQDGVLHCTGQPISVLRTQKIYTNFEIAFEWNHQQKGGNSGLFVWAEKNKIEQMTKDGKPGLPHGIEVQILDVGFEEVYKKKHPGRDTSWFTSHGDVFPVGVEMKPFPPLSPNGSRSFPSEDRVKPAGQWNHYYVRGINGEVRLWVNGKEVSGGNECSVKSGYLCLESEGAPIKFRRLRIRELA